MPGPPHRDGHGCPVRWSGRQAVVVLPGQVGVSNAGPLGEQLLAVIGRGAAVLIADMTGTRACDHAGTGALVRAYQQAVAQGTELRLVIPGPAVRRVVALSGLDRLVSVFSTLEAAQAAQPPPAVVLPLPPRAPSNGSAVLASPDGPRPVTRLPVAGSASLDGSARAAQQGMQRHEFEDTLTRITHGIFHAGLTLQTGLGQPADGLRQAAEHTLDLLDETVREAREAAFAAHRHAVDGLAGAGDPGTATQLDTRAGSGPVTVPGEDAVGPCGAEALAAGSSWARSRELQARLLETAVLSAATQDQVAASLLRVAASNRPRSARLRALSQSATDFGARIRQWADDHAATG